MPPSHRWIPVLATLLAAGCTHEYQLVAFNAAAAPLQRSQNKRVAIVLAPPALRDAYETTTGSYRFVIVNALAFYDSVFRGALGKSVASIEVFRGEAGQGFDAYVYPELSLETSGALSHTCTARFAVSVKDSSGRVVARNEKSSEDTYLALADAGPACTTAITAAFNATTYPTLAALDQW